MDEHDEVAESMRAFLAGAGEYDTAPAGDYDIGEEDGAVEYARVDYAAPITPGEVHPRLRFTRLGAWLQKHANSSNDVVAQLAREILTSPQADPQVEMAAVNALQDMLGEYPEHPVAKQFRNGGQSIAPSFGLDQDVSRHIMEGFVSEDPEAGAGFAPHEHPLADDVGAVWRVYRNPSELNHMGGSYQGAVDLALARLFADHPDVPAVPEGYDDPFSRSIMRVTNQARQAGHDRGFFNDSVIFPDTAAQSLASQAEWRNQVHDGLTTDAATLRPDDRDLYQRSYASSPTDYGDEDEFFKRIAEDPHEQTHRAVLADYLEDNEQQTPDYLLNFLRTHRGPAWAGWSPRGVHLTPRGTPRVTAGPVLDWKDVWGYNNSRTDGAHTFVMNPGMAGGDHFGFERAFLGPDEMNMMLDPLGGVRSGPGGYYLPLAANEDHAAVPHGQIFRFNPATLGLAFHNNVAPGTHGAHWPMRTEEWADHLASGGTKPFDEAQMPDVHEEAKYPWFGGKHGSLFSSQSAPTLYGDDYYSNSPGVEGLMKRANGATLEEFLDREVGEFLPEHSLGSEPNLPPGYFHDVFSPDELSPTEGDSWEEVESDPTFIKRSEALGEPREGGFPPILVDGLKGHSQFHDVKDGHHRVGRHRKTGDPVRAIYTVESLAWLWAMANGVSQSESELVERYRKYLSDKRGAHYSRGCTPTPYGAGIEDVAAMLERFRNDPSRFGDPAGDWNLRMILADALQDTGRDSEAALLRQPGRHVIHRLDGTLAPGRWVDPQRMFDLGSDLAMNLHAAGFDAYPLDDEMVLSPRDEELDFTGGDQEAARTPGFADVRFGYGLMDDIELHPYVIPRSRFGGYLADHVTRFYPAGGFPDHIRNQIDLLRKHPFEEEDIDAPPDLGDLAWGFSHDVPPEEYARTDYAPRFPAPNLPNPFTQDRPRRGNIFLQLPPFNPLMAATAGISFFSADGGGDSGEGFDGDDFATLNGEDADFWRKRVHYAATEYGFPEDRAAFEESIHRNPFEATSHLVMADFLDDNDLSDEAAFRRSMGNWFGAHEWRDMPSLGWTAGYHQDTPARTSVRSDHHGTGAFGPRWGWELRGAFDVFNDRPNRVRFPEGVQLPDYWVDAENDVDRHGSIFDITGSAPGGEYYPRGSSVFSPNTPAIPPHVARMLPMGAINANWTWRDLQEFTDGMRRAFMHGRRPTQASRYADDQWVDEEEYPETAEPAYDPAEWDQWRQSVPEPTQAPPPPAAPKSEFPAEWTADLMPEVGSVPAGDLQSSRHPGIDSIVGSTFPGAQKTVGGGWNADIGGGRSVSVGGDPENNLMTVNFFNDDKNSGLGTTESAKELRRGTMDMVRTLQKLAGQALRENINLAYNQPSDKRRAFLYAQQLYKMGFYPVGFVAGKQAWAPASGVYPEEAQEAYNDLLGEIETLNIADRYEGDGEPTMYGVSPGPDIARALAARHDDLTGHGAFADWLDEFHPELAPLTARVRAWMQNSAAGGFGFGPLPFLGSGAFLGHAGPFRISAAHPFAAEDRTHHDTNSVQIALHPRLEGQNGLMQFLAPGLQNADPRFEQPRHDWAAHGSARPVGYLTTLPVLEAHEFLNALLHPGMLADVDEPPPDDASPPGEFTGTEFGDFWDGTPPEEYAACSPEDEVCRSMREFLDSAGTPMMYAPTDYAPTHVNPRWLHPDLRGTSLGTALNMLGKEGTADASPLAREIIDSGIDLPPEVDWWDPWNMSPGEAEGYLGPVHRDFDLTPLNALGDWMLGNDDHPLAGRFNWDTVSQSFGLDQQTRRLLRAHGINPDDADLPAISEVIRDLVRRGPEYAEHHHGDRLRDFAAAFRESNADLTMPRVDATSWRLGNAAEMNHPTLVRGLAERSPEGMYDPVQAVFEPWWTEDMKPDHPDRYDR